MKELVSIVIPVYKAELHIRECIESVLEQDYSPLEIVLVNDGSPDKCSEICEEYGNRYTNVKVLHQENSGAGTARDNGVNIAGGKYIFFLDADDSLDGKQAISKLVKSAEQEQADITVGSFRKVSEKGISDVNYHHLDELPDTDTVSFRFKGYFQYGHLGFNWGKLYRKEFLEKHGIKSPAYPYIEDKAYNIRCSACKPQYAFVKDSVYQYRVSSTEVAFQDKEDFVQIWTKVAEDFGSFLEERALANDYNDIIDFHLFLGIYSLAKQKLHQNSWGIRVLRNALKEYGSCQFTQKHLKELASGKYVNEIDAVAWKWVIRVGAWLFCAKCYFLMAMGITLIDKLKVDKRVIAKKYNKREQV